MLVWGTGQGQGSTYAVERREDGEEFPELQGLYFVHFFNGPTNLPQQAANPDWNPTDPSGSLYLNRMADLSANLHHQISRRRQQENRQQDIAYAGDQDLSATVHFAPDVHEKAQYERALKQSQHAALMRRKGYGLGNSIMTMSMLNATGPGDLGMASSVYHGGASMARTAVLGDSQGSIHLGPPPSGIPDMDGSDSKAAATSRKPEDSTSAVQNEVGLGDSYVDGAKRPVKPYVSEGDDEEEELMDGGMMGLLAQIYGRRDGPSVGIS
jgi:autophagy-related protein 9